MDDRDVGAIHADQSVEKKTRESQTAVWYGQPLYAEFRARAGFVFCSRMLHNKELHCITFESCTWP